MNPPTTHPYANLTQYLTLQQRMELLAFYLNNQYDAIRQLLVNNRLPICDSCMGNSDLRAWLEYWVQTNQLS